MELFFKWTEQRLRAKAFYGVSGNVVKTQVWIAASVYVLAAIIKETASSRPEPLHNSTDFKRHTFRIPAPFLQAFAQEHYKTHTEESYNQ